MTDRGSPARLSAALAHLAGTSDGGAAEGDNGKSWSETGRHRRG